jgi:hypothetical protein
LNLIFRFFFFWRNVLLCAPCYVLRLRLCDFQLLVKLIRLIANLSISTDVGPLLATVPRVSVLVAILERALADRREELLLNAASAVTNLSFYLEAAHRRTGGEGKEGEDSNVIFGELERVCGCLVGVLLHENEEAVAEAARAFGNFSRDAEVTLPSPHLATVFLSFLPPPLIRLGAL